MKKEKINSIIGIILIIIFFIISSYLVQTNIDSFKEKINIGITGIIIFIIIIALSIIIAPVSVIPLFPLGIGIWGWVITAILAIIGWTIGAIIAFLLARKFGTKLIKKIIPIESIHKFEKKIPTKNIFWTIVFLRATIPIDGVSYLFGLFSKISLKKYTLATIIGLIPFSFAICYFGTIPIYYQIFSIIIIVIIILIGIKILKKK